MHKHLVFDLADIHALRIECATCGTVVAYRPDQKINVPIGCEHCHADWGNSETQGALTALRAFAQALRGAIQLQEASVRLFRLQLEYRDPAEGPGKREPARV